MEQKVQIIQPNDNSFKIDSKAQLNVCAYCRVSTQEEDQRHSLNSQKEFFKSFFDSHSNWVNIGIFADEGLSGTSLAKRDSFNRMLRLARAGKIDIILTKEVSRFSRNTKDLLNIVDELKSKKVYVWFLSDDINTEDNSAIQKLTEIATAAQAESLRTSRRVLWGQAQQMQRGVVFGRSEMYGYNIKKDDFGHQYFEIIEDEAEIVRKIFDWFSKGDGTRTISRKLQEEGIQTKRYKNGWSNTVILRILRNEKYVGDLAQGKTYTPNPLDHKKKYNTGKSNRYIIKDHHPETAIIDRATWDNVQKILSEKAPDDNAKAKHSNRYWSSGKILCGICGEKYVSYNRRKNKTNEYRAWVCQNNHERGKAKVIEIAGERVHVGCDGKRVNDRILRLAIHDIITEIIRPQYDSIINSIISQSDIAPNHKTNQKAIKSKENAISVKEKSLVDLTLKYADGKIPEQIYKLTLQTVNHELENLYDELNSLKETSNRYESTIETNEKYIKQVKNILSLSDEEINDGLYERLIKKIIVYPENILEIHISFLQSPIRLQYKTHGKGETYTADFTII